MAYGDQFKLTEKQECKADQIAEGFEMRGTSKIVAMRRAWDSFYKDVGGRKKPRGFEQAADAIVNAVDGLFFDLSEQRFDPGEHPRDGI